MILINANSDIIICQNNSNYAKMPSLRFTAFKLEFQKTALYQAFIKNRFNILSGLLLEQKNQIST